MLVVSAVEEYKTGWGGMKSKEGRGYPVLCLMVGGILSNKTACEQTWRKGAYCGVTWIGVHTPLHLGWFQFTPVVLP